MWSRGTDCGVMMLPVLTTGTVMGMAQPSGNQLNAKPVEHLLVVSAQ
jgi:hypothetical protein